MFDRLTPRLLTCLAAGGFYLHASTTNAQAWEISPTGGIDSYQQPSVAYSSVEDLFVVPMASGAIYLAWFDPDQPSDSGPASHPDGYDVNWDSVPITTGSTGYTRRTWPALAYNALANQFLVTFEQETAFQSGTHDIWAALCAGDGTCTTQPFSISTSGYDEGEPRVAFSPTQQRFLVVWRRTLQDGWFYPNDEIVGRFVSASGQLIGGEIVISDSFQSRAPAIAYSPDDDYFLVVWEDQPTFMPWETDIAGGWLRADGAFQGTPFYVATETGSQVLPRVAYDPDHGEYLIAWEDRRWNADIFGRRLHYAGSFLGSTFAIAWLGANPRTAPDVAYSPAAQQFRVVYESVSDNQIVGIRTRSVNAAGQLGRSEQVVASGSFDQCNPAIASSPSESLIVWQSCIGDQPYWTFELVIGKLW